ncbi:MAG: tetratricopeptide repeat protein [Synechococcales cyanobacterium CRU_2_2]|nr:tetratricopeptide repeat protein [Synechococcales cyanobacterium CRU_2_2]
MLLAQVQQQTGDREAAAQTYRTLIEKQPGNLKALQSLAALLMQENRPTAAVSLLQDTLKLAPEANQAEPGKIDEAAVKLMLGEVYTQQNRVDDAIKIYDEVQAENAEDFRPVLAKAMVFKNQGRDAGEYDPLFENAAALAPDRYKDQIQQLAKGPVTAPVGSKAEADVIKATTAEKAAEKSSGESVEGSAGQSVDAATPGAEAPADAGAPVSP